MRKGMTKRVLFVSRHKVCLEVKQAIMAAVGDYVDIHRKEINFIDGNELNQYKGEFDEFVIVAPNEIMATILKNGIKPLTVVMSYRNNDGKIKIHGQLPSVVGVKRILGIEEERLYKK